MDDKSEKKYELLLAGIITARATSFIFSKIILQYMSPFNLLALRFLIAFFLLAALFHRQLKALTVKTLLSGMLLGTLFFLTMTCELTALKQADSSLVSLLENCSIIFVPVFEAIILRRMPGKMAAISSVVAMLGVVLLAMQQGHLGGGFMFGLLAAVMYATAIVVTARVSRANENSLGMGIIQVGMIGFLALAATALSEQPHLPQDSRQWLMIAVLAVVCSGFGFTLQPMAQRHVSTERAGLFCAIAPAVASLLGVVVLHERFGVLSFIGLALILTSIMLPHLIAMIDKQKTCPN